MLYMMFKKQKELVGTKLNYDSYKKFTIVLDFLFQTKNALHTIHKKKGRYNYF